jgi:hypothetical protein
MEPRNAGIAIPTTRPEAGHHPHHLANHRGRVLVTEVAPGRGRSTDFPREPRDWRAYRTHDLAATMFIGPDASGRPFGGRRGGR